MATGGVDIATLGLRIEHLSAVEGTQALKGLEVQSGRTEAAVTRMGTASRTAGQGVNRLREPLTTLTYQLAGTNPQLSQFVSILGSLAIGSTIMVGVLAGLAAVAAAYRKLTEDSRRAREEQEKSRQELERWNEAQRRALQGEALAARELVESQRRELADLERRLAEAQRPVMAGGSPIIARRLEQQQRELEAAIREGQANINRIEKAAQDERNREAIAAGDRAIAEFKRQADERVRIAEEEARDLAAAMRSWVEMHGLGAGGGRQPGDFWDPGGTGRGRVPGMAIVSPSTITSEQRAASDALNNATAGATESLSGFDAALLASIPTIQQLASTAFNALISLGPKAEEEKDKWLARMRAEEAARAEHTRLLQQANIALAEFAKNLSDDLAVRRLTAGGFDDDAAAVRLQQQHARERQDFQQQFPLTWMLQPQYADLLAVQLAEMERLNRATMERAEMEALRARQEEEATARAEHLAEQEARLAEERQREADAARAAADAVKMLADAAEQLARQRDLLASWGDLNVRALAGGGFGDEAEALRLQLRHQREAEAASGMDAAFKAELARIQALEREQLAAQQRARSGGGSVATYGYGFDVGRPTDAVQGEIIRNVRGITETQAARATDLWVMIYAEARTQTGLQRAMLIALGGGAIDQNLARRSSQRTQGVDGDMAVVK